MSSWRDWWRRINKRFKPGVPTQHNGQHFFVMDYIGGKSLADVIGERRPSSDEAVQYLKVIAEAIHYAHQRQILHCDLKPANILIDDEGKLYVTDFGLAKRLGEDGCWRGHCQILGKIRIPDQVGEGSGPETNIRKETPKSGESISGESHHG